MLKCAKNKKVAHKEIAEYSKCTGHWCSYPISYPNVCFSIYPNGNICLNLLSIWNEANSLVATHTCSKQLSLVQRNHATVNSNQAPLVVEWKLTAKVQLDHEICASYSWFSCDAITFQNKNITFPSEVLVSSDERPYRTFRTFHNVLRYWQTRTHCWGHIVDHDVSWAAQTGKHLWHKMFLNKIRNIFCVPDTKFVSATNAAHAGKQGNVCVSNNVSATMCPRLPGPLHVAQHGSSCCNKAHSNFEDFALHDMTMAAQEGYRGGQKKSYCFSFCYLNSACTNTS